MKRPLNIISTSNRKKAQKTSERIGTFCFKISKRIFSLLSTNIRIYVLYKVWHRNS